MNVVEDFKKIIKAGKENELIRFLKSLSIEDKKTLALIIKKFAREYNHYSMGLNGDVSSELTKILLCSKKPLAILEISSFVCLSYDDMRRAVGIVSLDLIEDAVLPWYQPSWLNRYFIEMADFYIDYEKMLKFTDKGWLQPTKQFIADNAAYGLLTSTDKLQENIWYLFEYYTTIGNDDSWIKRFKKLSSDGIIARDRLLRETLLTSNRGFNKPMTSWYCKLFAVLEPTEDEFLNLQDELFLSLTSPQSKPVGDALKYIKIICKKDGFKIDTFMENIPLLLTWDVKSIVSSTLTLIDSLIKFYPKHKNELCLLATNALNIQDEKIQIKTLKLLKKYKMLENVEILDSITLYEALLFHSAQEILPIAKLDHFDNEIKITPPQHIREDNKIPSYESFDEMVFFFSQVFEGDNLYDFDLFVVLLPKLYLSIDKTNLSKLEPALYKALQYLKNSRWNNRKDIIVIMAQAFGYFWYNYLESFDILYENYLKKIRDKEDREVAKKWLDNDIYNFDTKPKSNSVFNVHHQLLIHTFNQIENKTSYEPIWTTTHSPCWIDSHVLSRRLEAYEKNNYTMHPFELQIALSKTIFDKDNIVNVKNCEMSALLEYLQIHNKPLSIESIENPVYWITALLIKNNTSDLELFASHFQKEKHDVPFSSIFKGTITHRNSTNTTFSSHCVQLVRSLEFESIYNYTNVFTDDLPYILALTPILPHFMLEARYKTPQTDFEVMMPIMIEIWGEHGENKYLFLARTFTDTSKITRQFTSELWIKATSEGTMNHQLLGQTLGKLEHNEYAPLKRFTDLIVANMLNISTLHNKGLYTLLSHMIIHMNDEPIKGTKKLLEIYLEVLSLTKLSVPSETMKKLMVWGEVKSLGAVVKKCYIPKAKKVQTSNVH